MKPGTSLRRRVDGSVWRVLAPSGWSAAWSVLEDAAGERRVEANQCLGNRELWEVVS